jgi:uncharacterized membrane protein
MGGYELALKKPCSLERMQVVLPLILLLLLLAAFAHFLPGWTRRDIFFAVTIDPAFRRNEAARRILRLYRTSLWTTTVISVALLLSTGLLEMALLQVGGFFVALTLAHSRVLTHAAPSPATVEVDLRAPSETFPGGAVAALLPLVSSALLALWASRHWSQLPERIPVHIGLHGVDRWVERTAAGVYGFIGTQAAFSMVMVLCAWGVLHWSRRLSGRGADAARDRQFRRLNVKVFLAVAYFGAAGAWIALLKPAADGLAGIGLLLLIAIYFVRLIRLNRSVTATARGDGTPDACWKLGIFYFNPADPSIFVAKRFGIGCTLNFGNRWTWTVPGVIIVAAVTRALLK